MITKELIESRWKLVGGAALMTVMAVVSTVTYGLAQQLTLGTSSAQMPDFLRNYIGQMTASFDTFVGASWFSLTNNGGLVMMLLAVILGAGLIAGETGKGTIFLLLSRPVSRDRVLLTKYGISALILLAVLLFGDVVLLIAAAVQGHPQPIGGLLICSLLFWLGMLFVLGLATLFSVIFSDVLRPLGLTLVIVLLAALPGFIPGWQDWSLPAYWTSLPAYLGAEFPLKQLIVALIAAALPLAIALPLFRRQQY